MTNEKKSFIPLTGSKIYYGLSSRGVYFRKFNPLLFAGATTDHRQKTGQHKVNELSERKMKAISQHRFSIFNLCAYLGVGDNLWYFVSHFKENSNLLALNIWTLENGKHSNKTIFNPDYSKFMIITNLTSSCWAHCNYVHVVAILLLFRNCIIGGTHTLMVTTQGLYSSHHTYLARSTLKNMGKICPCPLGFQPNCNPLNTW